MSDKLELDQSGLVISYEEYAPFGSSSFSLRRSKQEVARKCRFASYERDKETGLYYCNARYNAPWFGRWTSPDPIGTKDGLNLFCNCGNNPMNYTDLSGTMRGVLKGLQMAAGPTWNKVQGHNTISNIGAGVQPWQRALSQNDFKPIWKSFPAIHETSAEKERDESHKLQEYDAGMEELVRKRLGPMSKEIMKEFREFTLDQYASKMLKEAAVQSYKHAVSSLGIELKQQIDVNTDTSFPATTTRILLKEKVNNFTKMLSDAGEKQLNERLTSNEDARAAAKRHLEEMSKFSKGPKGYVRDLVKEHVKEFFQNLRE